MNTMGDHDYSKRIGVMYLSLIRNGMVGIALGLVVLFSIGHEWLMYLQFLVPLVLFLYSDLRYSILRVKEFRIWLVFGVGLFGVVGILGAGGVIPVFLYRVLSLCVYFFMMFSASKFWGRVESVMLSKFGSGRN